MDSIERHVRLEGQQGTAAVTVDAAGAILLDTYAYRVCRPHPAAKLYVRRTHQTGKGPRTTSLHRDLLAAGVHDIVDHINGDTLDNRTCNLRITDRAGNARNARRPIGVCGYRGIRRTHKASTFEARIRAGDGQRRLGTFPTAIDAARAYDAAARELHGEFAVLNNV